MAEPTAETPQQAHAREMAQFAREFDAVEAARQRLHAAAPALRDALRDLIEIASEAAGCLPSGHHETAAELRARMDVARAALAAADGAPAPAGGEG